MEYSVGQVSGFAGITVRTLHHYDKTGLLSPSARSPAGYRLYSDADLARLQQILFYRELGFSLEEIAAILEDPQSNALDQLRARHRLLNEQIGKLQRLVAVAERAMEVQRTGVELTPEERFEVFGEVTFDLSYATDAHLKWQHSEGHQRSMARAAAHTKEDWARIMAEAAGWRHRVTGAFDAGEPADGERAMELAEEHRQHITRWFTPCPPDMHCRIAADFVTDPRAFALVVPPSEQRPGLASYLCTAVHANAVRRAAPRTNTGAGASTDTDADTDTATNTDPGAGSTLTAVPAAEPTPEAKSS
ncbi:MerR family transcriptional regulator [Streptomyces sp. MST-110588]|uniref:MerR family transcriptional regulator n=1 Tax=Streptomyces sp. MST-110588 TaxID=2833628 RepID=UPI001F5D72FF|nr:MerR family transcriptional regulator [Streptomyces sp. MST-110588]UNO41548.1 MerR family transcriptional regulator [Streptomyces sp. MST-110588]